MANVATINPNLRTVPAYVPGKSMEELQREFGVEEIIKLGSNENPLGPSPKAVEAARQAVANMHLYPGVEMDNLRRKLAASLGSGFDADNVIIGNGSADIILSVAHAFLFDGGEVIISHPAFQMYELATKMHGGRCVFVEPQDYRYDLPAMADKITDETRMIFVTNPNNPTGLIVSQKEVDGFMQRVPSSVIVVFDEAYREYVDDPEYPDSIQYVREGRNVVITRTFSKIYGLAGMRVGYGIAHKELIGWLLRTQPAFHSGRPALIAALAALDDQAHVRETQSVIAEGRKYLYRSFQEMGLKYLPSQSNFILLIDLPHDVEAIDRALLRRGVILRPTAPFGIPQAIRVTIGTQEQNERVVRTLKQVLVELDRSS